MRHQESSLQIACVKWFRLQYPKLLLTSFPNGGNRDRITGAILKAEGAVAGSPDLFLFLPNKYFSGLAIEMKSEKGRQSESQIQWQKKAELFGYKYVICRSFEEFRNEVENYLKN